MLPSNWQKKNKKRSENTCNILYFLTFVSQYSLKKRIIKYSTIFNWVKCHIQQLQQTYNITSEWWLMLWSIKQATIVIIETIKHNEIIIEKYDSWIAKCASYETSLNSLSIINIKNTKNFTIYRIIASFLIRINRNPDKVSVFLTIHITNTRTFSFNNWTNDISKSRLLFVIKTNNTSKEKSNVNVYDRSDDYLYFGNNSLVNHFSNSQHDKL